MDYGLALSGGGPRGAAHAGVIAALEENRLLPSSVSGASAGSVAAALLACGYSAQDMARTVEFISEKGNKVIDPDILGMLLETPHRLIGSDVRLSGILKGNRMEKFFKKLVGDRMMNSLNMPIVIPSVDILSGKTIAFTNYINNKPKIENTVWYSNAALYEVMRASCSIPGVFIPKRINDMVLVDGGLTNNLPVDILIATGIKKVIGVDISSKYEPPSKINITETISSSFRIMSITLKDCTSRNEILLLSPPLPDYAGLFCFKCMTESMEIGYDYTIKNLSKIRSVLEI